MKSARKFTSVILALVISVGIFVVPSAITRANTPEDAWKEYYNGSPSVSAGILLAPGSDESETYLSWYTKTESGNKAVIVKAGVAGEGRTIEAQTVKTPQGDYRARLVFDKLEPSAEYSYTVKSGDGAEYGPYTFTSGSGGDFTAMYVTDVHITEDEPDEEGVIQKPLSRYSYLLNETLESALGQTEKVDLILSAGDQASYGLRSEYTSLVASPVLKSVPFALSVGNHDRKNIDYKYFQWQPNSYKMRVGEYIGGDYWFVKGNTLFLVTDSNNGSALDHRNFVKKACRLNPDVKWRVAIFHHDLYSERAPHREKENELLRTVWSPICDEFGIDLCLLGHSHFYTMSDVLYDNKSVEPLKDKSEVTDAKGTIYLVSGSINRPRLADEDTPLGSRISRHYDTGEMIYNLLDFSDDSLTISSYTVESGEKFNEFTLRKTDAAGGHIYKTAQWYAPIIRVVGMIYALFNNIGKYSELKELGVDVRFLEFIFGGK